MIKKLKPPNPKHLLEAQQAGIELLRRSATDPNGNVYRCPTCKSELALRVDLVRAKLKRNDIGNWPCEQCKWRQYREEAKAASLTIVRKASNTHNLIYKFNECAHEQEIAKQSVKITALNSSLLI